jgi:hypothetical protein
MSANLEVKGTLAKLLATEDIVVEHRPVETAQFDVDNRVLTLPIWDASNNIIDVLVAHEVGHALYTPNVDPDCKAPLQFLNITEDVRVEKLMKRKYMGIAKSFYRGYKELNEMDFFELQDLDTYNLADKVNLHFKIGPFLRIKFTPQEQEIVNDIEKIETFEDSIRVAETLYNFCRTEHQESSQGGQEQEWVQQGTFDSSQESGDIDTDSSDFDESPIPNFGGSSSMEDRSSGDVDNDRLVDNGPTVETQKSLGDKLKQIAQSPVRENVYIEKPHMILDDIIVRNEEISDTCEEFWDKIYAAPLDKTSYLDDIDDGLLQYKKGAEKEVNYLVKEFECRKSADAYARASTSRTGVLDTEKLHTYKFNEDIFKRVTVLPDGKNHGLLFLLDWSGSMHNCLGATVKQLLNLVWFCKKVNIPFRVYGFTNCYFVDVDDCYYRRREDSLIKEPKRNEVWIDKSYRLLEFLSSEGNVKQFERQVKNFWRLTMAMSRQNEWYLDIPQRFHLSGTPLDDTLIVLHEIIPQFKKKYGLQKVQTIILTDGESEPLSYACQTENPRTLDRKLFKKGVRRQGVFLRDRKLGNTYEIKQWLDGTGVLVQYLQDSFPDVNFIGIRLTTNGDFNKMLRWYQNYDIKVKEQWIRNKSVSLDIGNYTKFFALSVKEMNTDVEFDPPEEATKAQIRSAFKKSLNKSKFNRKILSEFVELVA